jgi:plasmid stability protein
MQTLKRKAKRHGRSLQAEVLDIIEKSARTSGADFAEELARQRARGALDGLNADAMLAALLEDRAR